MVVESLVGFLFYFEMGRINGISWFFGYFNLVNFALGYEAFKCWGCEEMGWRIRPKLLLDGKEIPYLSDGLVFIDFFSVFHNLVVYVGF
jgi:hypothetical protein